MEELLNTGHDLVDIYVLMPVEAEKLKILGVNTIWLPKKVRCWSLSKKPRVSEGEQGFFPSSQPSASICDTDKIYATANFKRDPICFGQAAALLMCALDLVHLYPECHRSLTRSPAPLH